jgi:hypothetical protein
VAKGLSYGDAVLLLGGGPRNRIVAALDRLTGGVLLAASATGAALPLSLFDAKAELFRLSDELVGSVTGQLRRAKRASRTECLAAANSVLVIAAFFEAVRAVPLPFDIDEVEITPAEQVAVTTGGHPAQDLSDALLWASLPVPKPEQPYEDTLAELSRFYGDLCGTVLRFFSGLAVWERLPESVSEDAGAEIRREVPARAVTKYRELYLQLATEFPEVAFWANLVDHQATRAEVRELRIALNGLADTLTGISTGSAPDEVRARLARFYQAYLRRPVLATRDLPGGVCSPTAEESYVNPDFRVAAGVRVEDVANWYWWEEQPRRSDLQQFLVGYLTSPAATAAPLVVMGAPGSGKSMLTQVLAAQLPANDFFAIRVALRELDADDDLQTHIEQSVRAATGENLSWRRLVLSAGDATPVVLVDGFDELLQATGLSQSSYLEKIAAFQQREADQGSPVVVVVTTRMSVAHRARPVEDMVTVLLEPFDDDQVARWLAVWHDKNGHALSARGLRPLLAEVALAQGDLAGQPLLLLMLALYDAEDNALQREEADLDEASLYERLLTTFARREVLKTGAELTEDQIAAAIDEELLVLAIVAFAMFNRQQLWVSEVDLDGDLRALGLARGDGPGALTAAQTVVGRFYFVHVAQVERGSATLRTFEFLHATFGEYLIARQVVRAFSEPGDERVRHALLSFVPLTTQFNTMRFIDSLIEPHKDRLSTLLPLFQTSLTSPVESVDGYRPVRALVPTRYAAYSANLFLLLVIAAGEVTAEQLFPDEEPVAEWASTARLWQSQLPAEGWRNLVQTVVVHREWDGSNRRVRIVFGHGAPPTPDPYWTYGYSQESQRRGHSWINHYSGLMESEAAFLCAVHEDVYVHTLEPLFDSLDAAIATFHNFREGVPVSAARALLDLWLESTRDTTPEKLADVAETCVLIAMRGFAPVDADIRRQFRVHLLNHLVLIRHRLPTGWVAGLSARFEEEPRVFERDDLLELTGQIVETEA